MKSSLLSVVIPAYNEEERLRGTLGKIFGYFEGEGREIEVLVVDDGSTDATAEVAESLRRGGAPVRILRNATNRGKGYSVRRGMLECRGSLALFTDADLSAPIQEFSRLERALLGKRYLLAFASRALPESRVEVHQSWFRESSGKIFNLLIRLFLGLPYRDTQCGFKLFRMPECRPLFERQQLENFSFDVELLYLARKWGLPAIEVPILWRHQPGSRVHFVRDAFFMILGLCQIRINDWRSLYQRKPS